MKKLCSCEINSLAGISNTIFAVPRSHSVAAVATATALVALFSVGAGRGILISSARRLLLNSAVCHVCVDPFRAGFAPIREFFIRRLAPRTWRHYLRDWPPSSQNVEDSLTYRLSTGEIIHYFSIAMYVTSWYICIHAYIYIYIRDKNWIKNFYGIKNFSIKNNIKICEN